jgi:hypothetical protein
LSFLYYFAHSTTSSSADSFKVFVEAEDGTRTEVYHENGSRLMDPAKWARVTLPLTDWAGQKIKVVFQAADVGTASTVEAGLEDVRIERP